MLVNKSCVTFGPNVDRLSSAQKKQLLAHLHSNWHLDDEEKKLTREFSLKDYQHAWDLVNKISLMAEEQWHHPRLVLSFGFVSVTIWTHDADDLVESDFIFAAKVDDLSEQAVENS